VKSDYQRLKSQASSHHSYSYYRKNQQEIPFYKKRYFSVFIILLVLVIALIARMVYLTVDDQRFLLGQGNARSLRIVNIPAYRGMILDRNSDPLAVSTPVDSVWVNPQDFPDTIDNLQQLGHLLSISPNVIQRIINHNAKREFMYLKREVNPALAKQVQALAIPGVYLEQAYQRFYPMGEAAAHVIGFTNIDGLGEEGLELAYNNWLTGAPGQERVVKDRYKHIVAILSKVRDAKPGNDLTLSIDSRIQFLAYRVLKATVEKFHAESGSVVVLNPKTGEILAMVNQPSYNPNQQLDRDYGQYRNRAVTDMFEPGSTMKAFSVTSAIDSGKYKPTTLVNTSPGWFKVGRNVVRDETLNHGMIDVTQILQKSSNVGVAKMTLSLAPEHFIDLLQRVGFGERTMSGFPGESTGILPIHVTWRPFELATLAFGYGISVTPLQLAHAYGVIADHGLKCPVSFIKQDNQPSCKRVMKEKDANEILTMLQSVLGAEGTGFRANISGYNVAGKTGTAKIAGPNGYYKDRHVGSFVGIAPVSDPQLVVAVVVRDPKHYYYGAVVAAPAFQAIMSGALRILNIPPDKSSKA